MSQSAAVQGGFIGINTIVVRSAPATITVYVKRTAAGVNTCGICSSSSSSSTIITTKIYAAIIIGSSPAPTVQSNNSTGDTAINCAGIDGSAIHENSVVISSATAAATMTDYVKCPATGYDCIVIARIIVIVKLIPIRQIYTDILVNTAATPTIQCHCSTRSTGIVTGIKGGEIRVNTMIV